MKRDLDQQAFQAQCTCHQLSNNNGDNRSSRYLLLLLNAVRGLELYPGHSSENRQTNNETVRALGTRETVP